MIKHFLIGLIAVGLGVSANAQTKVRSGKAPVRTVIVAAPVYPSFGWGFGMGPRFSPFYNPFYDPFYRNRPQAQRVPTELQLKLDEIENEFDFKIATTKDDNSMSGKERRQTVRELKYKRDAALIDAKQNFYRQKERVNEQ